MREGGGGGPATAMGLCDNEGEQERERVSQDVRFAQPNVLE